MISMCQFTAVIYSLIWSVLWGKKVSCLIKAFILGNKRVIKFSVSDLIIAHQRG